jgi:hypothetical protein
MLYDKLVKILDRAGIFDFDYGQRIITREWIITIRFPLTGTLLFVFDTLKMHLIDVIWSNV